jgi:hypothetical protein
LVAFRAALASRSSFDFALCLGRGFDGSEGARSPFNGDADREAASLDAASGGAEGASLVDADARPGAGLLAGSSSSQPLSISLQSAGFSGIAMARSMASMPRPTQGRSGLGRSAGACAINVSCTPLARVFSGAAAVAPRAR